MEFRGTIYVPPKITPMKMIQRTRSLSENLLEKIILKDFFIVLKNCRLKFNATYTKKIRIRYTVEGGWMTPIDIKITKKILRE